MRARNIKPGICANEVLGTADPFCTLLFERLWMMADREGRLEDRPLRIKAQAFPYRDGLDVDALLNWLNENGFIRRYGTGPDRYIQVLKFEEHQHPHVKEPASTIPAPDKTGARTRRAPVKPSAETGNSGSGPSDSGFRIPDSGFRIPENAKPGAGSPADPEGLDLKAWEVWQDYRKLKPKSIPLAKRKLASHGKDQLAVAEQSIANGWTGLFALKGGVPPAAPDKDAEALKKLADRRPAIGLADFRAPNPGETADQYREAQDRAWNALKRAPVSDMISQLAARMRVGQ